MKRPLPAARTDSFVTLLLDSETTPDTNTQQRLDPRVSARVQVVVPVSLTGLLPRSTPATEAPCVQPELAGVGTIDTDTAARIAHDSPTWDIVIVDYDSDGLDTPGDVLTVDDYRVPARQRRFLAARDQRCHFPGCILPVFRCEIDHPIAAGDGGPTATNNLGHLCRG